MKFSTPEERRAAELAGHDCCRGSFLVVRVGISRVALGRVIRLKLTSSLKLTSFKLEPGSKSQAFQLELLHPEVVQMPPSEEGAVVEMVRFSSTGRMLPHCSAEKVIRQADCGKLRPVKETRLAMH